MLLPFIPAGAVCSAPVPAKLAADFSPSFANADSFGKTGQDSSHAREWIEALSKLLPGLVPQNHSVAIGTASKVTPAQPDGKKRALTSQSQAGDSLTALSHAFPALAQTRQVTNSGEPGTENLSVGGPLVDFLQIHESGSVPSRGAQSFSPFVSVTTHLMSEPEKTSIRLGTTSFSRNAIGDFRGVKGEPTAPGNLNPNDNLKPGGMASPGQIIQILRSARPIAQAGETGKDSPASYVLKSSEKHEDTALNANPKHDLEPIRSKDSDANEKLDGLAEGNSPSFALAIATNQEARNGELLVTGEARSIEQLANGIVAFWNEEGEGRQTELHLRLDPPQLGSVRIHLTSSAHGVSAKLVVENERTQDLLESQVNSLRQRLAESGVRLKDFDVAHGNTGSRSRGQQLKDTGLEIPDGPPVRRGGTVEAGDTSLPRAWVGRINVLA
jgi:hypothetical protein